MNSNGKLRLVLGAAVTSLVIAQLAASGAVGQPAERSETAGGPARAATAEAAEQSRDGTRSDLKVNPAVAHDTDVRLRAQASGRSERQVRAERTVADRLGRVQQVLARNFGADFAGAYLPDEPGAPPVIRFAGRAPAQARQAIAREGLDARLVENTGRSLAELQGRSEQAVEMLAGAGFEQVMGYVDQREGRVVVEVTATPEASTQDQVRERLPAAVATDHLDVVVHEDDFVVPEHTRGGAWMRDDGARECTAGWSVERLSDGLDGIATAAHCYGLNQYEQPGYGVYSAPFAGEHIGSWGEMEWHTTSHIELPEFYATSSQLRDVNSVEPWWSISVGESVCIYGRSSNSRACDLDVYATNVSVSFSYAGSVWTAYRMVMMDGDRTISGDSGGGWSWGTRAYGIHFGDSSGRNVWSVADYLDEAIGVRVLTN